MGLKAVFLDFSGVIIDDEEINQELVVEIMLSENLRVDESEYIRYCRGRSDRVGLRDILASRGRILPDAYLDKLIKTKTQGYRQKIDQLPNFPLSPYLVEFLSQLNQQNIAIGLVSGAIRSEIEYILQKTELANYFDVIVAGDDLEVSKPEPEPYLLALKQLNLRASECLAIEENSVGIEAAKKSQIQVVGISSLYPLHMLQRQANWTVDNFLEIELERVDQILSQAL